MTDQLTPQQEREYVKRVWLGVTCIKSDRYHPAKDGSCVDYAVEVPGLSWPLSCCSTSDEAYHAAYLYTKEHERKIAEVEEEIEFLGCCTSPQANSYFIRRRIIAQKQSLLAELMRGWKGEA